MNSRAWGGGLRVALLGLACGVGQAVAADDFPPLRDAETIPVDAADRDLGLLLRSTAPDRTDPVWLAWSVPMQSGAGDLCCWRINHGRRCGGCALEGDGSGLEIGETNLPDTDATGDRRLVMFVRREGRTVTELTVVDSLCRVDAAGRTVYLLAGADERRSIDLLTRLVDGDDDDVGEAAIMALAYHADERATETLFELARGTQPRDTRRTALFWLSQRAGERVASTILDIARNDPDAEVMEAAVFGLSQLPRDQGIPRLVELARSHGHLEVRKSALFWLGQSDDPRALELFEEILD